MAAATRATGAACIGDGGSARPPLVPDLHVPEITPALVALYRPRVHDLSRRITEAVARDVAGYQDPSLKSTVRHSIESAVGLFIDALAGAPVRGGVVAAQYRRLGHVEARAGHDLDSMRAAHQVATQLAWEEICAMAEEFGLSARSLADLGAALFTFQQRLHDHTVEGFTESRRPCNGDADADRARHVSALLSQGSPDALRALVPDGVPVPARLAVIRARFTRARAHVASRTDLAWGCRRRDDLVLVTAADDVEPAAQTLAHTVSHEDAGPVAISWEVDLGDVPHAVRWTARALGLARAGTVPVPADLVLRCADLRPELLIHADPALRRHVADVALAPLRTEKPGQQKALAETMLLWLQTRGSAPVLAARLGVHDQTVRLRLRRIKHLFGEALDDPRRATELLQALQAERGVGER